MLSVFFGAGVVLSTLIQKRFVTGNKAGLESFILGSTSGIVQRDVYLIGGVAATCVLLVGLLYKEFKVVAFDPGFARVQGWPALWLDLALMGMIALSVVIGLPAVGVVMVAALLIIPAASARFWTERLEVMLALSAAIGGLIGVIGTLASARFSLLPAGPVIVLVGSAFFMVSILFAPRRGVIARIRDERRFRRRIAEQNVLRAIHHSLAEKSGQSVSFDELLTQRTWTAKELSATVRQLQQDGLIKPEGLQRLDFTPDGARRAAEIVHAMRLWNLFLTEYADLASGFADLDLETLREQLPTRNRRRTGSETEIEQKSPVMNIRGDTVQFTIERDSRTERFLRGYSPRGFGQTKWTSQSGLTGFCKRSGGGCTSCPAKWNWRSGRSLWAL